MARFYEQLAAACAANQPFALALIAGTKGSSPQRAGAKAIFFGDGKITGTLSLRSSTWCSTTISAGTTASFAEVV
jgi:hypothetical protein